MDPRTTTSGRAAHREGRTPLLRRRPPAAARRPALYLSVAAAGAVMVNVLVGSGPAAQAEAGTSESVSVARELGLTATSGPADATADLQPLEDLAASRSSRAAEQTAAAKAQSAADQAERNRQEAEADAKAKAEADAKAKKKAAAQAKAQAAAQQAAAAAPAASSSTAATQIAHISNSAGEVRPQVQTAANAVVSNVPGAAGITLGGTRPSATDPGGHPSGLALDYMVMSDAALGDAIVQYHRDHWDELGVDYIIWQQRYLASPNGAWEPMSDRGSPTANHMDHPHVNYRG